VKSGFFDGYLVGAGSPINRHLTCRDDKTGSGIPRSEPSGH